MHYQDDPQAHLHRPAPPDVGHYQHPSYLQGGWGPRCGASFVKTEKYKFYNLKDVSSFLSRWLLLPSFGNISTLGPPTSSPLLSIIWCRLVQPLHNIVEAGSLRLLPWERR